MAGGEDKSVDRGHTLFLLTISFRPEVGGVETRLEELCRGLIKRGYRVVVYTFQPIVTSAKGLPVERSDGLEIRRVQWIGQDLFHRLEKRPVLQMLYLVPYLFLRSFCFLLRRRGGIHMIHAAGFNAALTARFLSLFFRLPFVVSTHSTYGFENGSKLAKRIEWILRRAQSVVAVSSESADELEAIGVPKEKVIPHTTWVDLGIFSPLNQAVCRKTVGLPERFTVLFVGRMKPVKGIGLLLEVSRRCKDITFVFAGTGELEKDVEAAADKQDNIVYCGRVPNEELPRFFGAADVMALPSSREGFPRTVAESLACGTPVIVPDMPGLRSVLNNDVAEMIAPSADTVERAILAWRERCRKRDNVRQTARLFAEATFSEKNVDEILTAYGWE